VAGFENPITALHQEHRLRPSQRKKAGVNMTADREKMGYWSAVAIGVGGMVGGGIFAVLGLSVQLTRGAAPVAFLIAGLVALVTSYAYTHLSVTYPNEGGTVAFLDNAFGPGLITGAMNVLLWISYIVMLSLYTYAFGSYGSALFPEGSQLVWKHVLISGSILAIAGLNMLSAKFIGEVEGWIVATKIAILLLFIVTGTMSIDNTRLLPDQWSAPMQMVAGGMIIFLAYEGFELIANTADDIQRTKVAIALVQKSRAGPLKRISDPHRSVFSIIPPSKISGFALKCHHARLPLLIRFEPATAVFTLRFSFGFVQGDRR
jgi:amino acid transporter